MRYATKRPTMLQTMQSAEHVRLRAECADLRAEYADLQARLADLSPRLAEAEAREALATGAPLTVAQVALLAGMVVGSVRNATCTSYTAHHGPDRLCAYSERGQTLVAAAEAARWLAGRRKAIL